MRLLRYMLIGAALALGVPAVLLGILVAAWWIGQTFGDGWGLVTFLALSGAALGAAVWGAVQAVRAARNAWRRAGANDTPPATNEGSRARAAAPAAAREASDDRTLIGQWRAWRRWMAEDEACWRAWVATLPPKRQARQYFGYVLVRVLNWFVFLPLALWALQRAWPVGTGLFEPIYIYMVAGAVAVIAWTTWAVIRSSGTAKSPQKEEAADRAFLVSVVATLAAAIAAAAQVGLTVAPHLEQYAALRIGIAFAPIAAYLGTAALGIVVAVVVFLTIIFCVFWIGEWAARWRALVFGGGLLSTIVLLVAVVASAPVEIFEFGRQYLSWTSELAKTYPPAQYWMWWLVAILGATYALFRILREPSG